MTNREIFDLVIELGEVTLQNGGEISRTTMTMERAAKAYGIREFHTYVIANGIFSTGIMEEGITYSTKIKTVALCSTCLCRVEAANNLSRQISSGSVSPEDARARLNEVKIMTSDNLFVKVFSCGLGSACFCFLVDGQLRDCAVVFVTGMLLYYSLDFIQRKTNILKFIQIVLGSAFVALFCCIAARFAIGGSLDKMIIGSMMSMVPGIPLTNGIRHFFDNDYLSGLIRLFDAFLIALSIAMGVGIVLLLWNLAFGGIVI